MASHPPPPSRLMPPDRSAVPPYSQGSLAVVPLIPDKRYYGETPACPARVTGAVSGGIAGSLVAATWLPHDGDFSVSHWRTGTWTLDFGLFNAGGDASGCAAAPGHAPASVPRC